MKYAILSIDGDKSYLAHVEGDRVMVDPKGVLMIGRGTVWVAAFQAEKWVSCVPAREAEDA